MSSQEFQERFDVLYNNITSNQAPGLNLYEISVFLTKAQDEIIKNYFNPRSNRLQEGYDGSQKRQIDFSKLTAVKTYSSSDDPNPFDSPEFDKRSESKSVALEEDIMFIISEHVEVTRDSSPVDLTVRPLSYDEYDRLMSKPYKRPIKYQAWRLINYNTNSKSDLIVGQNDEISSYTIRYVKRPKPIIVGPLDGLTINGYCFVGDETPTGEVIEGVAETYPETKGCELDPILHEEILQRAIELAKIAWASTGQDNLQAVVEAGQRSE